MALTTSPHSPSSSSSSSSFSPLSAAAEDHAGGSHHKLASEVPKKRTGRRVFQETRHAIYRGVRSRKGDKWVCELREPNTGTRVWLGTYTNPEMAARAHDVAALAFRGKLACLNFADSAWRLPVPASPVAGDVRRAAAEAAEMFRPVASTTAVDEAYRYMEEEMEVEDMPRLLLEMAEGLLLPPPPPAEEESESWWGHVEGHSNDVAYSADPDWSTLW